MKIRGVVVLAACALVGCGDGRVAIDGYCDPTWTSELDGGLVMSFTCEYADAAATVFADGQPHFEVRRGGGCRVS